jgi:hypothetical protein
MRRRYLIGGIVLIAGATAAGALYAGKSEPWKDKPIDQWTDKDAQRVFTDSPWVQHVTVEAAWKPLSAVDVGAAAAGGAGSFVPAEYDINAVTRGQATLFSVYWISSRTMRAAVARKTVLHSGGSPEPAVNHVAAVQKDFQVAVEGTDMAPFQRADEKKYQEFAWLQLKNSKDRLLSSHVNYQKDDRGLVNAAIFYFPKEDSSGNPILGADTKEVQFACKVGASTIHAIFDPLKMVDMKGPDL